MEDYILLNISNEAIKYIFKSAYNSYFDQIMKKYLHELIFIYPTYPIIKMFINYYFNHLIPALNNLDKNVCFLDIDEKYDKIRLSCDWCSLCNGIIETAKQNIIKNPKLLKKIDFQKLEFCNRYLNFILIDRSEKITDKQIKKWCKKTFGKFINSKNKNDLLLLSQIYLKFESIELIWCPFKRSKEFYYRNKDKRFLEPTEKIIYKVGKILSKYETINCHNCPKIVNANWKYTKSNKQSIFQPLLDYMMEEIKKNEVKCPIKNYI
jgi:hypothetical protein